MTDVNVSPARLATGALTGGALGATLGGLWSHYMGGSAGANLNSTVEVPQETVNLFTRWAPDFISKPVAEASENGLQLARFNNQLSVPLFTGILGGGGLGATVGASIAGATGRPAPPSTYPYPYQYPLPTPPPPPPPPTLSPAPETQPKLGTAMSTTLPSWYRAGMDIKTAAAMYQQSDNPSGGMAKGALLGGGLGAALGALGSEYLPPVYEGSSHVNAPAIGQYGGAVQGVGDLVRHYGSGIVPGADTAGGVIKDIGGIMSKLPANVPLTDVHTTAHMTPTAGAIAGGTLGAGLGMNLGAAQRRPGGMPMMVPQAPYMSY